MKIAMIVPFPIVPPDDGGRRRPYSLLKHLAPEHDLVLLTPRSPANAAHDLPVTLYETSAPGRRHQILSRSFLTSALTILRRERPDLLIIEFPWSGIHGAILAKRLGIPLVLDAPNVEGDRFRTTGAPYWRGVAAYEWLVARLASRVFVVSEEDRARFIAKGVPAAKLAVVPNGVDPGIMHPDEAARAAVRAELGIDDSTRMHFFFGQLDYAPNREALAIIASEILPRLDATGGDYQLTVAGKGDLAAPRAAYSHPRLRFLGAVPAIAPYINAADDVLVPIRSGGGTRLKILETIACGTPVVSTTIGAEGIDAAVCGGLLAIEDGWDAFAAKLSGAGAVKRTGNVPAGFLDRYSWATIVHRIEWHRVAKL